MSKLEWVAFPGASCRACGIELFTSSTEDPAAVCDAARYARRLVREFEAVADEYMQIMGLAEEVAMDKEYFFYKLGKDDDLELPVLREAELTAQRRVEFYLDECERLIQGREPATAKPSGAAPARVRHTSAFLATKDPPPTLTALMQKWQRYPRNKVVQAKVRKCLHHLGWTQEADAFIESEVQKAEEGAGAEGDEVDRVARCEIMAEYVTHKYPRALSDDPAIAAACEAVLAQGQRHRAEAPAALLAATPESRAFVQEALLFLKRKPKSAWAAALAAEGAERGADRLTARRLHHFLCASGWGAEFGAFREDAEEVALWQSCACDMEWVARLAAALRTKPKAECVEAFLELFGLGAFETPQGMQEQQAILGEVSEHVVCTYGDAFPPGPDSLTYKLESPGAVAAWVLGVVADCFGRGQCAGAADFDYLFETEAQRLDLDRVLWGIAHFHSVGTEALSKAMLPLFVLRRLPELEATLRGARDADAVLWELKRALTPGLLQNVAGALLKTAREDAARGPPLCCACLSAAEPEWDFVGEACRQCKWKRTAVRSGVRRVAAFAAAKGQTERVAAAVRGLDLARLQRMAVGPGLKDAVEALLPLEWREEYRGFAEARNAALEARAQVRALRALAAQHGKAEEFERLRAEGAVEDVIQAFRDLMGLERMQLKGLLERMEEEEGGREFGLAEPDAAWDRMGE